MRSALALAFTAVGLAIAAAAVARTARWRRHRFKLNACLHELRRPLTTLALERRLAFPALGREGGLDSLSFALAALDDLDHLINGVPRGGERQSRRRPVDSRELATAAAGRWALRAERAGRVIRVRWWAGSLPVRVDPVRASQALDNLIANAIEHGRGPVVIEGRPGTGRVEIAVRDSGPKVPLRLASRSDVADPRRGHGLRLSRELVAGDGGELSLRRGPAQTAASLSFPLVPLGGLRAVDGAGSRRGGAAPAAGWRSSLGPAA